jgi:hypothetical protein
MKKTMKLDIPRQLELLCTLMDTTPEELLQSFIHDVSRTPQSNGSDEREMATEYLLRCTQGQYHFDDVQIKTMLLELDVIRYERCQFTEDKETAYRKHTRKQLREWFSHWQKVKENQ